MFRLFHVFMGTKLWIVLLVAIHCVLVSGARGMTTFEIKEQIQKFKADDRGPYQAIRWYCPDGSVLPAHQRCPSPGGMQHAMTKTVVERIARENGIFLGQILAGTDFDTMWDAENRNSRIKQYQLQQYLQQIDDGWIWRRARHYRGAVQREDEEAWGERFLNWALSRESGLESQFFLIRQACGDLPHGMARGRWQNIRTVSKSISDTVPAFMDLRVKLHGQPDRDDLLRVRLFREKNAAGLSPATLDWFAQLEADLHDVYHEDSLATHLNKLLALKSASPAFAEKMIRIKKHYEKPDGVTSNALAIRPVLEDISALLLDIRKQILLQPPENRLAWLDLSIMLEGILFRDQQQWHPATFGALLQKGILITEALAGCGYLALWEWEEIHPWLQTAAGRERLSIHELKDTVALFKRLVEWGTGMVHAVYAPEITAYSSIEPLSRGFVDDRIRSSILLGLGRLVGDLDREMARVVGSGVRMMDKKDVGGVRGLNPGYAMGELIVIPDGGETEAMSDTKVYAMIRPPADLKPVAGILTVSEGNLVSHVQLLARNLGIPNAVISRETYDFLAEYSGQRVFYAVSPGGNVLLKLAGQMTPDEGKLVAGNKRKAEKILVPASKIDLNQHAPVPLSKLRAADSGRVCGPKAANLGQLKALFPDQVADGFVLPFGMFRDHLNQTMPGRDITYWGNLRKMFSDLAADMNAGVPRETAEKTILGKLAAFQDAIRAMPFLPGFENQIVMAFSAHLGSQIGQVGVFIRSDTNMEDLKDFTGAGLNLTLFNVRDNKKIFQGIREVWASPYSERSYGWRQKYLSNPENVYPSILVLPAVNVDVSGVMITTGVSSGRPTDLTVAFSRGAGGAVEGQAAETWLLREDGTQLLISPCRETLFNRLPETGGVAKGVTHLNARLLTTDKLVALRQAAMTISAKIKEAPGIGGAEPYDIELGFKGNALWLFQVRPYVENRQARSNQYLYGLDVRLPGNGSVALDKPLM